MSQDLFASKVVVVEEEPKVRGIASASTSVVGAVGETADGPLNTATLCTSFAEYEATFGGFTTNSNVALAAMGFFENGGDKLWVSRIGGPPVAASLDILRTGEPDAISPSITSTVAPPYTVHVGDSMLLEGSGPFGDDFSFTITFQALPATGLTLPGPFALSNGMTLELTVDGALHTATFSTGQFANIGAATASEVGAAIVAAIPQVTCSPSGQRILIRTVSLGPNATLEFTGGSALLLFADYAGLSFNGTSNVQDLNAVTGEEIVTLLTTSNLRYFLDAEVVETGIKVSADAAGGDKWIQITGVAATIMGFDSDVHYGVAGTVATVPILHFEALEPGPEGNDLSIEIDPPSAYNEPLPFQIQVRRGDDIVETFDNVWREVTNERFIETIINDPDTGSQYVRVTNVANFRDLPPQNFIVFPLTGGTGGPLTDADFIGDQAARTGLHAFDAVQDLSVLLVPGRATPAIHQAMLQYCEVYRDGAVFALLDPPANTTAADMVTYVTTTASLENSSEYGAIYWPRVMVANPDKSVFGSLKLITVPPSGIIAGVYARTDGSSPGGVYGSPAGIEAGQLLGVLGFETDEALEEPKRDLVYPHRINPLTTAPGLPRHIDGSRTLKGTGTFPSIAARRGVMFIEQSLKQGLAFARHKNNTPELRAQVRRTLTAFLLTQMNNGAFRSRDPAKAFFVDVSDLTNSPSVVAAGKLIARVGLAMRSPVEFIVLEISQDTRAIDAELAGV